MKKRTVKHVLFGTVQYGLMLFYAVFLVLPVFFSFMSSIRPSEEIFKYASPFSLSTFIPRQISLESFRSLFVDYEFMKPLVNTVVVCAVTVVLGLALNASRVLHCKIQVQGQACAVSYGYTYHDDTL